MHSRTIARGIATVILTLLAHVVSADNLGNTSHDGLTRIESKNIDAMFVRPGATLTPYKRIAIIDCYVAFRKNWQRDQNSTGINVRSSDMNRIKTDLANEFRTIFTEELTKGGYEVVNEAGDDVLILRPMIVDLDIVEPDVMTAGRSRTFSTTAGSMTLVLELFDGASGQIIARAIDNREARDNGRMTWQNSITNRAEATRMLRKWAVLSRNALDRAHNNPAQEAPGAK